MKILLIQPVDYLSNKGGAYKANRILLEGLAARGHACRVLTTTYPRGREEYEGELRARGVSVAADAAGLSSYRHAGVEVLAAANRTQLYMSINRVVAESAPDWVLLESPDPLAAEAALDAAPSRVVYLCHTATNLPFGPDCVRPDAEAAAVLRRVGNCLTVSGYMKDYVRRWGGMEAGALYWPSYGAGPFPRLGRFGRGFVTLVNPCPAKGSPIFFELARRMPSVEFAAVPTWGKTDEELSALKRLDNVTLLEPQADVDRIFERTRVLLAPSLGVESFGQIVVEAMARGIPVLASDLGGLREAKLGVDYLLPVRRLGYEERAPGEFVEVVPEQDAGPWQEALAALLADPALYARVADDSRAAALSFIGGLGIEPFERYLETLTPAEVSPEEAERARKIEQLKAISPERRALLALRLANKGRGGAGAPASPA